MAAALAAVRLQPWQPDVGGEGGSHGRRSTGGSCGGRVSAFGGFPNREAGTAQQSRGKICRVPPFRTFSPRREALTSAMSEERDITDMQETDKVSGEWWNHILTAVRDWSHDKLLGLAELADGSLFFSFGPGRSDSRPSRPSQASSSSPQPKAQSEATPSSKAIPRRHPSRFRKLSPIPAYRKTAKEASPTAAAAAADPEDKKSPKKVKTKSPSKVAAAQAQRPASSFSKRSPIPKERAPIAKKKNQETEVASTPATNTATVSPKPPEPKESAKSATSAKSNKGAVAQTPAKKKVAKVVVKEETVVEVAATTSSGAESAKETSTFAAESEETTSVDDVSAAAENGAVASEDLGTYKLPELRSLAKARGLKGYSKLKKGELVDLLAALER